MLLFSSAHAIIYDNRYFLGDYYIPHGTTQSRVELRSVIDSAQEAFQPHGDDALSLAEVWGRLDENTLGNSLTAVGKTNPLPSAWQGKEILWKSFGKVQMQSLYFEWHQQVYGPLSTGVSGGFMTVCGYNSYRFERSNLILGPGDPLLLEETLREMFDLLQVNAGEVSHKAFSDIDWYLRLGKRFEYALKFKSINIGGRFGVLLPSGPTCDQYAAAAIPFGGDGHWGVYGALDAAFEVKEDMTAGIFIQGIKRLSRTLYKRMPVFNEPQPLGAAFGNVHINPGYTLVVAPYIMLENLRKGLGFLLQYTLRVHQKDQWRDERRDKTVPVNLEPVIARSQWGSDYFSLELFYDFGKERMERNYDPMLFFRWDIPYKVLVSERAAKTEQLSCGIACLF